MESKSGSWRCRSASRRNRSSSTWAILVRYSMKHPTIDYELFFRERIAALKAEGRYRYFAELERKAGQFPRALRYPPAAGGANAPAEITVWCSNDYLGMGQHPVVLGAMEEALRRYGAGAGGTRNIAGTSHVH